MKNEELRIKNETDKESQLPTLNSSLLILN